MITSANQESSFMPIFINETTINCLITQFRLQSKYTLKASKEIMDELSKEKSELTLVAFIKTIVSKKPLLSESLYREFYLNALHFFLTPSEQIKDILRQAKDRIQDEKLIKNINWAINSLNETDIYDFNLKSDFLSEGNLHIEKYIQFLSEYSYDLLRTRTLQDLKTVEEATIKRRRSAMISMQMPNTSNLLSQHNELLKSIESIDFDIFSFKQVIGEGRLLYTVAKYIFEQWDMFYVLSEEKFSPFIKGVANGYKHIPYHNIVHATDVLQTTMIILQAGNFIERNLLEPLDIAAVFVGCILHDICHPGLSNQYQVNKPTSMALRYNDKSPLENMHCYEGFKLLLAADTNLLEDLAKEEVNVFRRRMIDAILSTDGSNHSKVYNCIKGRVDHLLQDTNTKPDSLLESLTSSDDAMAKYEKQQDLINYIVHAADISNPAKNFENVYSKWTELVMTEFFMEGDLEKQEQLPVNFLCDRATTVIPKAQINFIRFLVMPTFKVLIQAIPKLQAYDDNMNRNIGLWEKELEKGDKEQASI